MDAEANLAPRNEDPKARSSGGLPQRAPFSGRLPAAAVPTSITVHDEAPPPALRETRPPAAERIYVMRRAQKWRRRFAALFFILVPTIAAAVYCYKFAAPMYLSSSSFAIYGQSDRGSSSVVGKIMQATGGGVPGMMDGFAVRDYLLSFDAMQKLDAKVHFVDRMKQPRGDFLLSLQGNESNESILDFYHRVVKVRFNMTEGIVSLDVYAYDPKDAYEIASGLSQLAGEFSNNMNRQMTEDTLKAARDGVDRAETRLSKARLALADWRKSNASLDVEADAKMIMTIVGQLETQLSETRAQLQQLQLNEASQSPVRRVLEDRIEALTKQIAEQNARLTGNAANAGDVSVANRLVDYQGLVLEQEFASKEYEAALLALNNASNVASVQQKFIASIVAPHLPGDPSYPDPDKIIPLTLIASIFAYLLGSLAFGAMRDSARA